MAERESVYEQLGSHAVWERDDSSGRVCVDCGQPLIRIHPQLRYELQWGHTSLEDAQKCTHPRDRWPLPQEADHA